MSNDEVELLAIRKLIGDKFECKKGCADCCGKFIPLHPIEKTRIEAMGIKKKEKSGGECGYLGEDNSCTIYDERPLLCRVFGLGYHPMLACPHKKPRLSKKRIDTIEKRYTQFIKYGDVCFL